MAPKPDLKAEGKELAALIASVRKKAHNFAMLIGKGGLVIEADKKKSAELMRRAAKANGGGSKGTWGVMQINSKVVVLDCEVEPPGNLLQVAKKHFAERGQPMRFEFRFGEDEPAKKEEPTVEAKAAPKPKPAPKDKPKEAKPEVEAEVQEEEFEEDDASLGDIKAIIAGARKRPYNFACLLGKEEPVLKVHLRKPIALLIKQAKADGASARGGWGRMSVQGKLVILNCDEDPPEVLARALKIYMRSRGVQMGVKIVSPSGEMVEASEDAEVAPVGASEPAPQSDFALLLQAGAHFAPLLEKGPGKKLAILTGKLQEAVDASQLAAAQKTATMMERMLPADWRTEMEGPQKAGAPGGGGAPKLTKKLPEPVATPEAGGPNPEEILDEKLKKPQARGYPRRFKVTETMSNMELSILIDVQSKKLTREQAVEYNKTPANRVQPLDFEVTQEHVDQGFVTIIIIDNGLTEIAEGDLEDAQESFDALDAEAQEKINDATDAAFCAATGFPEGEKLKPGQPGFEEMSEAWMAFRADQLQIQDALSRVPPRIMNMFNTSEDGVKMTPAIAEELANIATKLSVLSDEELADFWDGLTRSTDDIMVFSKSVDNFLTKRYETTEMGGGDRVFEDGEATGDIVAKMRGFDIKAEKRETRDFGSKDQAIAFARSLGKGAAVMIEEGRYVVYQVDLDSIPLFGPDLELSDAEISITDDPNDTWVHQEADNLVAVISDDDYVFDTSDPNDKMGEINRVGGTLGPFDGHIQAFGPGLKLIKDRKTFEAQFELVMRDATYDALNKAEKAARDAQKKYKKPMTAEDKALAEKVLDDLAPLNKELEDKEFDLLLAKAELYAGYAELLGRYLNPLTIPSGVLKDLITTGELLDTKDKESTRVEELQKEVAILQAKRTAAAAEFPLALRIEDAEAFKKASPDASADMLEEVCGEILSDIKSTRDNVDDGDFNFWNMPDVAGMAIASTGLQGQQLQWAQDKIRAEGIEKMVWAGGEAVLTIGLAIGAIFASGGTALLLGGASVLVGGASAYNVTEEYFRDGSAANIALDPSQGLLDPDEVQHWGWVVAAWVGVGLDVAGLAATQKAVRSAIDILEEANDLSKGSDAIKEAAKVLGISEEAVFASLQGRKISSLKVGVMGEAVFDESFGRTASEAATVFVKNADGGYSAQIIVRAGADPMVRELAVAEEMRHLAQLSDPKFADDVALLTEDALANWATKSPVDKMRAAQARLRLEADSQATALEQLRKKVGSGTDEEVLAKLQFEIDEAEGALARYMRELDEVEKGLDAGKIPAGMDLSQPTRLFNTPNYLSLRKELDLPENAGLKKVIDDFFGDSDDLERSYYYLTKKGDQWGLHKSKKAPPDAPTLKINGNDSSAKIVQSSRKSAAEMRAEVMKDHGAASVVEGFEEAIGSLATPYQKAYTRKFEKSLDILKRLGGKSGTHSVDTIVQKVIEKNGGDAAKITDATFENAFRQEMRSQISQAIADLDGPKRAGALKASLDAMPDNASQGALFAEYRRLTIRDAKLLADEGDEILDLSIVSRTGGDLTFTKDGKSFMGDGILETGKNVAESSTRGPKLANANYMVEDKSSFGAFDLKQFERYASLISQEGGFATSNGKTMQGVTYFFPDQTAAQKVIDAVAGKVEIPDSMHIAYYGADGKMVWLR